jgi:hypothetical protein
MAVRDSLVTVADGDQLNDGYFNGLNTALVPIGGIISYAKTFVSKDSGTASATTANKLVEAGQNFNTTVVAGYVVYNTTDLTFAYVTAVDSDTTLSLSADIMASGEGYTIYATPALSSNWVECNGQVLSDADSLFNGATMPDLNTTQRFLRGAKFSGTTGGADSHSHKVFDGTSGDGGFNADTDANGLDYFDDAIGGTASVPSSGVWNDDTWTSYDSVLPSYYQVVFIMRVK